MQPGSTQGPSQTEERTRLNGRTDLAARLRERSSRIEREVLARVYAVSDPSEIDDPGYVIGLRDAVGTALEHSIAGIEAGADRSLAVPEQLLAQARLAARNGVSLDTVLRRYFAGYTLLGDFVVGEADDRGDLSGAELQGALRAVSTVFDRLVATVAHAYVEEAGSRFETAERRHGERVKRLLAGELVDAGELRYGLDAWHLAAVASGPGAVEALRDLAAVLDRNLLLVRPEEESVWAWLGGRSMLSAREVLHLAEQSLAGEVLSLALGESGQGIEGWRLTHRQAKAAMSVARRGSERLVRYADVALLASALRDDVLAGSLREIYLAPLKEERDGGAALRETLDAYFIAGRNASSAAAALRVSRQTVNSRLRSVEERIGRRLDGCAAELETALRLDGLSNR